MQDTFDTGSGPTNFTSSPSDAAVSYGITFLASDDADLVGRQIALGAVLILGRAAPGAEEPSRLEIKDDRVSRTHATLFRSAAGFDLHDNGSRNGTFVDGARSWETQLQPGAIVRLGNTIFEIGPLLACEPYADEKLLGCAPVFQEVLAQVARVAPTAITVTLFGETGTGKDVVARRIHERSGRSGPFVAVNCAAIPAELSESTLFGHRKGAFTGAASDSLGLFGEAEGGTLFLDEIGELGLAQQAKLLRVLENREYIPVGSSRLRTTDARVVAATNADLDVAVRGGRFRDDLLARLSGTIIELPPLRARRSDIPLLCRRFLDELSPGHRLNLEPCAIERLLLHSWPHNIRELRRIMHRLVDVREGGDLITAAEVELAFGRSGRFASVSENSDRRVSERPGSEELAGLLRQFHGNVARLAAHYGKDAKQIYRWLKRYQLVPDAFR